MQVTRCGDNPSEFGGADNFTGRVRRERLFVVPEPGHITGGLNTFEPGARTVWHTHPLGQVIIVTAGLGRVQSWGGPITEVRPGDVVYFEPGEKHWHGASPKVAMSHINIVESLDGKAVDWLEPVEDSQYTG